MTDNKVPMDAVYDALGDMEIARQLATKLRGWVMIHSFWHSSANQPEAGAEWNPCRSYDAAFAVQSEIKKRGWQETFMECLAGNLGMTKEYRVDGGPLHVTLPESWLLANATPRQRCIAAIHTLNIKESAK